MPFPTTLFIVSVCLAAVPACAQDWEPVPDRRLAEVRRPASAATSTAPERMVAVTFDDLPTVGVSGLGEMRSLTHKLVGQLTAAAIPAIGFVNEEKLAVAGQEQERTALLEHWLEAGLELGNHTYSHKNLWQTPLAEYQADVLRGERVTKRLLAGRGEQPRYFRHTFLNTGPDRDTKAAFERFLSEHGYQIAPVTIDNLDITYALAYRKAAARGDTALMRRIGEDYIRYMDETFAFYEQLSRRLLGREPGQTLLLHANTLNAEYMDELAAMMKRRGYGFVSLERALEDPAYGLRDNYVGRQGLSWLQRWAITQDQEPGEDPAVPDWVQEVARS